MKKFFLLITTSLLMYYSFAQSEDVWVRFYNTAKEQSGYKDLNGRIKIPPKFEGFTRADTFYNIIAVTEIVDDSYKSYYLLKDGRKVGQDSVYVFDFTFDCESEGKIKYYDRKKDRVGFFDKQGVAIIPAIYNDASPFRNGLSLAHINAKRKCWDNTYDTTNCEHLGWEGGETILINDKNEILADSIDIDLSSINWYSKKENVSSIDTSIYVTIKGKSGVTFSFVSYEKEFKKWFNNRFLPTLNSKSDSLDGLLFPEVTYWSDKGGWNSIDREEFLKLFPEVLVPDRFRPGELKKLSTSEERSAWFINENKLYKRYYDACGEHNRYRFPVFDVMLTYYKKRLKPLAKTDAVFDKEFEIDYQRHFLFLRTDEGYKLWQVSL